MYHQHIEQEIQQAMEYVNNHFLLDEGFHYVFHPQGDIETAEPKTDFYFKDKLLLTWWDDGRVIRHFKR